jgi:hypothetical protein
VNAFESKSVGLSAIFSALDFCADMTKILPRHGALSIPFI